MHGAGLSFCHCYLVFHNLPMFVMLCCDDIPAVYQTEGEDFDGHAKFFKKPWAATALMFAAMVCPFCTFISNPDAGYIPRGAHSCGPGILPPHRLDRHRH